MLDVVIAVVGLVIGGGVGFVLAARRGQPQPVIDDPVPSVEPEPPRVVDTAEGDLKTRETELQAEVTALNEKVTDVEGVCHGFKVRIEELETEVRRYKRHTTEHLDLLTEDLVAVWASHKLPKQVHALPFEVPDGAQEVLDRAAGPLRHWVGEFGLGGKDLSYFLGLTSALGGRWEEAAKSFERAAFDGFVPEGWLALGDCQWQLGRPKKASRSYLKCLDRPRMPVHIFVRVAKAAMAERRFDDALDVLDRVLSRKNLDEDVYLTAAGACLASGDNERAVAISEAGLEQHPESVNLLAEMVIPLARAGDRDRAEEVAAEAQELDPEGAGAPYALGVVYMENGSESKAVGCFEDALVLRPGYPEALCGLGIIHNGRGEFKKALEFLNPAVEKKPDYAEAYFNMRASYEGLRDFDNAIAALNKAVKLNPDYA